ncbi:hypothetical protein [Dyadobacter sp. CY323]|uniref:hypothetical protein n=1 Tax=Dyadobacter sp. CY323 TaxID=2907302 RepID=UPI001F28AEAB|nr:hypothetical protein [Dyadobacter sp. CY323]MCE6992372.1 hypothetical protein [Dyadobacter sp. CY323]
MQNGLRCILALSVFGFTLFSCEEREIQKEISGNSAAKTELLDFRGEMVSIQSSFPKELFDQSLEDFDEYYDLRS